jgi:hypothetical protein
MLAGLIFGEGRAQSFSAHLKLRKSHTCIRL